MGVTLLDHVTNDTIRITMKVAPITKKVQERRLRWYGHVRRREEEHITRLAMSVEVPGRRPRGRPKLRWTDKVKSDLRELGIDERQALDRETWRRLIRVADPVWE